MPIKNAFIAIAGFSAGCALGGAVLAQAQPPSAGFHLSTPNLTVTVRSAGRSFKGLHIQNHIGGGAGGRTLDFPEAFTLVMKDGSLLRSTAMPMSQPLTQSTLKPVANAQRLGDRLQGKEVCATFAGSARGVSVRWCAIARQGEDYFRQQVKIAALKQDLPIAEVRLLGFADEHAHVQGTVKGSPIVDGNMFFGFEHPLSTSSVKQGQVSASIVRDLPLRAGQSVSYSAVVGATDPGQMRRAFLRYLENERPRPYRPFLHYNSWYDLGYQNRYDQAGVLDRIHSFGTQLVTRRGVRLDSFLMDDGWDDPNSLWSFAKGFPDGFTKAAQAAEKYHADMGVWLSPWGGYAKQKQERIAFGREHGYEIVKGGFALSGPKYYAKFEQSCLNMTRQYKVNQFKFDGTGNANSVFPGSAFDSDFDAAIHLIGRLRQAKPGIFINLTTGTAPSPFWVFYADSTWRGGDDHSFAGVGSSRQRWITYRDQETYRNIVRRGPLYPLNSLMLHGIIYARYAEGLKTDPQKDFADEVHSYFGSGTQLQEMYITPGLLIPHDWNTLAEAARWSRAHAGILKDVHWIGGDPGELEVYGWAAWNRNQGIVTLRNPSDHPQTFALDVQTAFELPKAAAQTYTVRETWKTAHPGNFPKLLAGHPFQVELSPFEVLTLEATPSS